MLPRFYNLSDWMTSKPPPMMLAGRFNAALASFACPPRPAAYPIDLTRSRARAATPSPVCVRNFSEASEAILDLVGPKALETGERLVHSNEIVD
jgi:hypothetical protein